MKTELETYRTGTGKVISVGDFIKVDKKTTQYRVTKIVDNAGTIECHCWGGRDTGRDPTRFRVFLIERCSRVLNPKESKHGYDEALRPKDWSEYIGQGPLKAQLDTYVMAAIRAKTASLYVLLFGPPGVGKTSLATVIANRLKDKLTFVERPVTEQQFIRILYETEPGIVFIDEIHRWPRPMQEMLFTLIEGGRITTKSGGTEEFAWITVIAATTERSGVIKPLRDRFPVKPEWQDYSIDEMAQIVGRMALRLDMEFPWDSAVTLAKATCGVPRAAMRLVVAAQAMARRAGSVPDAMEVLAFLQIDEDGLTPLHRRYLEVLRRRQAGIEALCTRLQLDRAALLEVERVLDDRGFIDYEPRGRVLTSAGRRRLDGVSDEPERRGRLAS